MPTVTIKINGGGFIRVSKKSQYETAYTELGIAKTSSSDWEFPFWSYALFSAFPNTGWQFTRFCADSNNDGKITCGSKDKQMIEAEIDKSHDELIAYFSPIPPPPPSQPPNLFDWIRNTFFWWIK